MSATDSVPCAGEASLVRVWAGLAPAPGDASPPPVEGLVGREALHDATTLVS